MDLRHAAFLLLLFCSANSYRFRGRAGYSPVVEDPEQAWERMKTVTGNEMAENLVPKSFWSASDNGSTPQAKRVREYQVVSALKDHKEDFKPEMGVRPLPAWVSDMLLKTATDTIPTEPARRPLVEILCHVDRVYVRIRRKVFKTGNAHRYLKFGTCRVNQVTKDHYYFLYLLTADCGFRKKSTANYRYVGNVLTYKPTTPVLREMPFDIPMQCKFPRFFHSYKVGFYPTLQGGTFFKSLNPKSSFTLTSQDASGFEITGTQSYILGQTMYFQATQLTFSKGLRIYINHCFMTAFQNPASNPKYTVIDNYGCMVDSMRTEKSKFLSDTSQMALRFSVAAVIFKDRISTSSSSQQLYMHCDVSMGPRTPTESSKTCNYDHATKEWKELYDRDSVCTCCDSTCPSAKSKASSNMISSPSWKINLSNQDRYGKFHPRMKSPDADFSLDDAEHATRDHAKFLKYWGRTKGIELWKFLNKMISLVPDVFQYGLNDFFFLN
ncbi:LOW QUALITY PROTEIN: zona pellucida sperm-binding protein 3 [Sander vitreus]